MCASTMSEDSPGWVETYEWMCATKSVAGGINRHSPPTARHPGSYNSFSSMAPKTTISCRSNMVTPAVLEGAGILYEGICKGNKTQTERVCVCVGVYSFIK